MMADLISRSALMRHIENEYREWGEEYDALQILGDIEDAPSIEAEPVKPIGYKDCSNAMLMLWMDKVVTDSEYNRIMDRLNKMYDRAKMDEVKK